MGNEAKCTARFKGKESAGKALLETKELVFRGDFRLAIPLEEVRAVRSSNGILELGFTGGTAVFELGPLAAKWEHKIKNPKSVLDKLGVKAGMSVAVLELPDPGFWIQLRARVGEVSEDVRRGSFDLIFFGAPVRASLARLAALAGRLEKAGALWVVRPKGVKEITEADVMSAGKAAGLVDVKVVAFSATHTAEKFVIPLARR